MSIATTTLPASPSLKDRLTGLLDRIGSGQALTGFQEYYAPEVVMQENELPPTLGFTANLARERAFHAGVLRWRRFDVLATAIGEDVTMYECLMEFDLVGEVPVRVRQVAIARWRDGRIVHERFVYDTAPRTAA